MFGQADPSDLPLPSNWEEDHDAEPEGEGYFMIPGTGTIIPEEDMEAAARRLYENAREHQAQFSVPDLFDGYMSDGPSAMPYPKKSDFFALAEHGKGKDFWDMVQANDPRSYDQYNRKEYEKGWHRPLFALLSISMAKDTQAAIHWAGRLGGRKFNRAMILKALQAYHGGAMGEQTELHTPGFGALMKAYAKYVGSAAPTSIVPLEKERIDNFAAAGIEGMAFPTAELYGADVLDHIGVPRRQVDFYGSRDPDEQIGKEDTSNQIITGPTWSSMQLDDEDQMDPVHAIRITENGELVCYIFPDIFYNVQGILPADRFYEENIRDLTEEERTMSRLERAIGRLKETSSWKRVAHTIKTERVGLAGLETIAKNTW